MTTVVSYFMAAIGKAKGVGFYILVIMLIIYNVNLGMTYLLNKAATDYAYEVTTINLKGAGSHEEIRQLIVTWKELEWGAQLGAIKTLCDVAPERLDALTGYQLRLDLCRLVR